MIPANRKILAITFLSAVLLIVICGQTASSSDWFTRNIKVKVVADQTFYRQPLWQAKAEQFITAAEPILFRLLRVHVKIVGYVEWNRPENTDVNNFTFLMTNQIDRGDADILMGFCMVPAPPTSQESYQLGNAFAYTGMMVKTYQNASERNKFVPYTITHEMGHIFGAIHTSEHSLMYPFMGDTNNLFIDDLNSKILDLTRDVDFAQGYSSLGYARLLKLARLYEQAMGEEKKDVTAPTELGSIYLTLQDYAHAIAAYQMVIEMEPTWTYPWVQMAYCYYTEKRLKEAVAVLEKAVNKVGDKGLIYNRLAVLYYNLKDYRNSLRYAELAQQNGADVDPDLWNGLKARIGNAR